MSKEENDLSFEQGIKRLEEILSKLENEETPLEEMIDLYEKSLVFCSSHTKILSFSKS